MSTMSKRMTWVLMLTLFAAQIILAAASVDETAIGTSFTNIIDIVLKYIVPGLAVLIVIWGAVDVMSSKPGGIQKIIGAIIGLIIALGARAIITRITGVTV